MALSINRDYFWALAIGNNKERNIFYACQGRVVMSRGVIDLGLGRFYVLCHANPFAFRALPGNVAKGYFH